MSQVTAFSVSLKWPPLASAAEGSANKLPHESEIRLPTAGFAAIFNGFHQLPQVIDQLFYRNRFDVLKDIDVLVRHALFFESGLVWSSLTSPTVNWV